MSWNQSTCRPLRLILSMVAGTIACFAADCRLSADEPMQDIRELRLRDWQPRSMLVAKESVVERPKFPAVDVHNHLGGGRDELSSDRVAAYLTEMDAAGVRTVINLDGGWGNRLKETLAALDDAHPGRFYTFALLDFDGVDDADWGKREAERLEESFRFGAKGLKFHKSLGLGVRYANGKLMPVDDPRLEPIWEMCAKHHRPVMIHSADPAAFFTPLDRFNERWHELNEHPNWLFYGERFPPREELLRQFIQVVAKHPRTTFIGAHFGNNAEDLSTVADWLDQYPNLMIDIDARISELGRQPYATRRFLIKHQDRVMFGTDTNPRREAFRIYYRFLETDDEYFDCAASHHLQGFWRIYGVMLPDEVLEKIYYKNADRIFIGEPNAVAPSDGQSTDQPRLLVRATNDFSITGDGTNAAWGRAEWVDLRRRGSTGHDYAARFKMLYSANGLYVLLDGTDKRVTATLNEDFADLWNEDVFEFFLWTDERLPIYFEYEISPLGKELPILIPNVDGKFLGWRPWHYEGERKIKSHVAMRGGRAENGAEIMGWTAEVFVPFDLLKPLGNVPPRSGSTWRANIYRVDYDDGQSTGWDWSRVGPSFHDYRHFGTLRFE